MRPQPNPLLQCPPQSPDFFDSKGNGVLILQAEGTIRNTNLTQIAGAAEHCPNLKVWQSFPQTPFKTSKPPNCCKDSELLILVWNVISYLKPIRWWKAIGLYVHWRFMSNKFTKEERENQARDRRKKLSLITLEEVVELFDYWIFVLKSESARKPLMNDTRRQLLAIAIHDYGMDYCKQAIDGCSNSHYHMGRNKQGKVYNSIELIFRDNEHIERFAGYMDGGG